MCNMSIDCALAVGAIATAVGAFLKWATVPVLIAYELGKAVERIRHARETAAR